jgi:hypothetical protein
MVRTVWAAAGLGNLGGFGIMMGRKTSPQLKQMMTRNRIAPRRKNRFIQTPREVDYTETVIVMGRWGKGKWL